MKKTHKLETKCGNFTMFLTKLENGYCYLREYSKSRGSSVKARISNKQFENIIAELS